MSEFGVSKLSGVGGQGLGDDGGARWQEGVTDLLPGNLASPLDIARRGTGDAGAALGVTLSAEESGVDDDRGRDIWPIFVRPGWGQREGRIRSKWVSLLVSLRILGSNGLRCGDGVHGEGDSVGGTGDNLGSRSVLRLVELKSILKTISPASLGVDLSGESGSSRRLEAQSPPICLAVTVDHPPVWLLDRGDLNSLGIRVRMIDMSLANENDKGSDASEEKDAGSNSYTDEDVPSRGLGGEASEKDTRQEFTSNVTMEILVELGKARLNQKDELKEEDPAPGSDGHYDHRD